MIADEFPLPPGLRVGCVRYLNSRPLIHGHDGRVQFAHPARLADDLAAGQLDAGLVPVFEFFQRPPGTYRVVDGVAIACRGTVGSVFLAHRGRLADVRRVRLDAASRTSANLLRVLLGEFHGLTPEYVDLAAADAPFAPADAREGHLLIGDQAIAYRARYGGELRYFDLGEQWRLATGLPFVFAAWLLRGDLPRAPLVAETLRAWRDDGRRRLAEIIAAAEATRRYPPGFPARYLTEMIRYDLGPAEKIGLAEYGRLLCKHGLVAHPPSVTPWL